MPHRATLHETGRHRRLLLVALLLGGPASAHGAGGEPGTVAATTAATTTQAVLLRRARAIGRRRGFVKPPPRRPRPARTAPLGPRRVVGWGAGEGLTYHVRLGGIETARASITTGRTRQRDGRQTVTFRGLGETIPFIRILYRMREELVTIADLTGLWPLESRSDRVAPGKTRKITSRHGPRTEQRIERPLPADGKRSGPDRRAPRLVVRRRVFRERPLDALTALYYLRSAPLRRGDKLAFTLLAGTALHQIHVTIAGRERLSTVLGMRSCLRLDGSAMRIYDNGRPIPNKPRRSFSIWLTVDDGRIPVRVAGETDLGLVTADLSSYQPTRQRVFVRLAHRR